MNQLEEKCLCFWKTMYEREKNKEKSSDSFDTCRKCEGYDSACKNYSNVNFSVLNMKTIQTTQ